MVEWRMGSKLVDDLFEPSAGVHFSGLRVDYLKSRNSKTEQSTSSSAGTVHKQPFVIETLGGGDYLFAFRMFMVLFRREFSFGDSLYLWEIMWSLEYDPALFSMYEEPELLTNKNDGSKGRVKSMRQFGKYERENMKNDGKTEAPLPISVKMMDLNGSCSINKQVSASSPTGYKVKLCDREGTKVARGHVVTDSTSGMCHCRRVLPGERKVYVEEILIGNALVYDGLQDGNSTMEGFIGGGYVIWLEVRIEKM